jgi:undecaprenyl phosphate-alpha-L-ara4N flippase subunit ArnF
MIRVSRRAAAQLFAASVVLTTVAQLAFKVAMQQTHTVAGDSGLDVLASLIALPAPAVTLLATGLFCYGLSLLAWIAALTRFDVSVAYPALSISYVLVYLGAVYLPWLHETTSLMKLMGIVTIVTGVTLVAISGDRSKK